MMEFLSCSALALVAIATVITTSVNATPRLTSINLEGDPDADIGTAQVSILNAVAFPFVGSCTLIFLFLAWKFIIVQYALVLVRY